MRRCVSCYTLVVVCALLLIVRCGGDETTTELDSASDTVSVAEAVNRHDEAKTAQPDSTIVKGLLIDENGVPIGEQDILMKGEKGSLVFHAGILKNPKARSDDSGYFEMVIHDSIFEPKEPLSICLKQPHLFKMIYLPMTDSSGIPIVFVIDKQGGVIDLGTIHVKKEEGNIYE